MSNALGIASVTHILKDLLYDGLIDQNVSNVTGNPITVSSLPPGEIQGSNGGVITSQINIFLYRVSPNTGWNINTKIINSIESRSKSKRSVWRYGCADKNI